MSTLTITHHPIQLAIAATAVAAAVAVGVTVANHDSTSAQAPGGQSSVTTPHYRHYPPLHGGTVMMGQ
jgi:hypothetical protein